MTRRGARRRQSGRRGDLLLGIAAGIAAGSAGVAALLKRQAGADAHALGRSSGGVPEQLAAVGEAPAALASATREAGGSLKERWESALAAGKAAAKDKEAELYAQLRQERAKKQLSLKSQPPEEDTPPTLTRVTPPRA